MTPATDRARLESVRIALDVTAMYSGTTGVARYVRETARALTDRGQELAAFAIGRGQAATDGMPVRRLRVPLRIVHRSWAAIGVPRAEWIVRDCALVHIPDLIPPPTRLPLVMTVHDLDAVDRPDLHPPRAAAIQSQQAAAARDRAAVVLTSAATAPLLEARGVERERIIVTPSGVTPLPEPDFTLVPPDPYFLVVGALALRKGQDVVVSALGRAGQPVARLVLAGPDGWGASRVRSAIARYGGDMVTVTGPVSDAQLAGLYRRCAAVCVPSHAEGFGIPILEAAALGVPVVASDIRAARELQPAVSLFVPPGDEVAWAAALEQVLHDPELRPSAGEHGPAFAAGFTWDRVASVTLSAYQQALKGSA